MSKNVARIALTAASVVAAVVTWAWSDVLLWQRIFESRGLDEFDASYQTGHAAVLIGLIVLGAILLLQSGLRWSIAYATAVYTLAYGGAADVLYYWLDRRPIPPALPWLDQGHPLIFFHPVSADGVLASAAIWAALWVAVLVAALVATLARRPSRRAGRPARKALDARTAG